MQEYYWSHNPKSRFKHNGEKHLHKAAHRSIVAILVEFIAANGEIAGPRTVRILVDYLPVALHWQSWQSQKVSQNRASFGLSAVLWKDIVRRRSNITL